MAPEQTGRMNRSIDSRSDLYSFGVTLYQMLTGSLPFTASDPIEWVHCHIAKKPLPPSVRVETVPETLSDIVMKLLAKTAEERYQTAAAVEHDLRRCLADWQRLRHINAFALTHYQSLTAREREVMALAAKGLMNKQIAGQMNLSEITVKIHRAHAMKKMHAKSFADLVRMAESLEGGHNR